ncbi:LysM peptidoglycan-binding domain-containing protein [Paenibacillus albicereus]|uniref:LysM peptidoglycan-binding domain-containing protein n=2 Tax=Paenibacillus albicereus TaxID=2726185 RepID=A0A6H2H531_9BACL|nr:LysM peptidoglycan-binding domain-containing protein [Paenibacillus albicereus]
MKTMLRPMFKSTAAVLAGLAILSSPVSASAATTYVAKDGDTFWKLAQAFHVPVDKLMDLNEGVEPTNIYAGLKLSIPAGTTIQASAAGVRLIDADAGAKKVIEPSGKSHQVKRTLQIKASAYTSAASENGKWGAVDYFGNPLRVGTVAVDPNRIPLGTKLYITGYSYDGLPIGGMIATATDTGGSIKGDRIDIFVPGTTAEARSFGFQWVKVHVLG